MLADKDSSAIVAVSDLARARSFYADTLDLPIEGETDAVLSFRTGNTRLVVYASDEAGSNRANAAVWSAGDDTETIVRGLIAKGVRFEHYDMGGDYADGIHHVSDLKLAWFKDPDGNILHINSM